ncbi:hypothetical protein ACIBEJ_00870 [Nonomuraea sp. NPDC050790]|uniref:hypothetical protein n=1 Tax=Nonomuraea sp. NPDC050790 TaxID=3364371 RepID=UPI0037A0E69C
MELSESLPGPLYTLEGAKAELDRLDCARNGHDIEYVLSGFFLQPKAAFCARRCGHPGWAMIPADQTHLWRQLAPVISNALTPYPSALAAVNAAIDQAMTSSAGNCPDGDR